MKGTLAVYCLLFTVYCLSSCSSGTGEKKDNEIKSEQKDSAVKDTTMRGLAGVIDKAPPLQDGDYTKKYPNGVIQVRGYYIMGKRQGQWTTFFENGKVQSEGFYKDGVRDGKAMVYFPSGILYYEGYYRDGKEVGKWKFYDETGKLSQERDYGGQ